MGLFLHNPEFKSLSVKLGVVFIIGLLLVFALTALMLNALDTAFVREMQSIAGAALAENPGAEARIAKAVTQGYDEENAKKGASVLAKYGYGETMGTLSRPFFFQSAPLIYLCAGLSFIILFALLFFLLRSEYKKIYRKIQAVAGSAEKVVEGDIVHLSEAGEGDFYKLGHSFNRMAERVRAGMLSAAAERQFLRNAISDISHQIKTPLSSVMVFNELMASDPEMEVSTREEFLSKSQTQLLRIQWLVESLLKMAMLEAGTIEFKQSLVDVQDMLEKAVLPVQALAEAKGVAIRVQAQNDARITCDEKWTAEACTNIVKNAVEHTPEGGEVNVASETTGLFTRIRIADNGEGISEKDLPHIFERFYRGNKPSSLQSVGVGLSLSKLIVEGQGGLLSVRSEKGKGSEFEIVMMHAKQAGPASAATGR